jgi:hypothetical protein
VIPVAADRSHTRLNARAPEVAVEKFIKRTKTIFTTVINRRNWIWNLSTLCRLKNGWKLKKKSTNDPG